MHTSRKRKETDSFGVIEVPVHCYWGAQTERSLQYFQIGCERMPDAVIRAFGIQKKAVALVNMAIGDLDQLIGCAIVQAADEVTAGLLTDHFPLVVWQTGSGTQTNMNTNEVIANRAIEILGGIIGSKTPVHPNDHVNMAQSSNDSFPTVMHIAAVTEVHHVLLPALHRMREVLMSQGSPFVSQIEHSIASLEGTLPHLCELAQGGTAVGTGLHTRPGFDTMFAAEVARITGMPFVTARNKFEAIAAHDALVELSGVLSALASCIMRITNNGACINVIGHHVTVTIAGASGILELNVMKPVIIYNVLESIRITAETCVSFADRCVPAVAALL